MATRTEAGVTYDVDATNAILCDPSDLPKLVKHWLRKLPPGTSQLDLMPCKDLPGRFTVLAFNDIDRQL
jgi:hypothetical protein